MYACHVDSWLTACATQKQFVSFACQSVLVVAGCMLAVDCFDFRILYESRYTEVDSIWLSKLAQRNTRIWRWKVPVLLNVGILRV
jgi:hypothetical protein